jgi:hypothetical protein
VRLRKDQVQDAIRIADCRILPKRLNYKVITTAAYKLLDLWYNTPCTVEDRDKFWANIAPSHTRKKIAEAKALMKGACRLMAREERSKKHERKGTSGEVRAEGSDGDAEGLDVQAGCTAHCETA